MKYQTLIRIMQNASKILMTFQQILAQNATSCIIRFIDILDKCIQFMHAKTTFIRDFIFSSMLCHNIGMWCAYIKWFTLMFEKISVFLFYSHSRMV